MSPLVAAGRLRTAERELRAAVREGRSRDVAAWGIAVDVLLAFATGDSPYPADPTQPSLRS